MKTDAQTVYIHFCMQRKNNQNIPYNLITIKKYICKENALLLWKIHCDVMRALQRIVNVSITSFRP